MLQRAASNAYSWWWASHIRTKQSKWLEHNMQDMDDKVKQVIEILEEDGDSFSRRAEMYYKRRPEIVDFVEESYKQYRALADRYDHLSRELQSANRTIAIAFPEQIPFMDEEENPTVSPSPASTSSAAAPPIPLNPPPPRQPVLRRNYAIKTVHHPKKAAETSGLSQAEAVEEIDRIQKEILTLQTEKEFVKCSYESSLARCSEIEDMITEAQQKVCSLQDEFGVGSVIEDDDARYLMAATALKSSQDLLLQLQDKREKSIEESKSACEKIVAAQEKLKRVTGKTKEDHVALTGMTDLADEINEHVSKVVSLETLASSQGAMVARLTSVANDLHSRIQSLQTSEEGSDVNIEEELDMVRQLEKGVEIQSKLLHSSLVEAASTHHHLTQKLEKTNKFVVTEETQEKDTTRDNPHPPDTEDMVSETERVETDEKSEVKLYHSPSESKVGDEETKAKEDREKVLLEEYSAVLRDYRELKEEFTEMEKKNRDCIFNTAMQMRELRKSNAVKEEEIQHLHNKVCRTSSSSTEPQEDPIKQTICTEEDIVRESIDVFLDENMEIWLRLSSMLHQVHKFQASMKDLQQEASKKECSQRGETQPIYKHMREIQREMNVWMEQKKKLKEEVERRWGAQKAMEEEMEKEGGGRLMGEVMNIRRQNERVVKELEEGGERVKEVKDEIEKWLEKTDQGAVEEIRSTVMPPTRQRIPLRSFLFGVKMKKQKPSLLSCINPALQKQYSMHNFDVQPRGYNRY